MKDTQECPVCGGFLIGDGYTTVLHCENAEEEDYENVMPDADIIYCRVSSRWEIERTDGGCTPIVPDGSPCLPHAISYNLKFNNLKFRVFDPITKKLTYFGIREGMGNLPMDIPDRNITQFSGRCDKNGVEIYSGDFLYRKAADITYKCDFDVDSAFVLINSDADVTMLCNMPSKSIEVVGNIFC